MLEPMVLAAGLGAGSLAWGIYDPNSRLFGPVTGRGPRERVVYLTFDDGPNPGVTEAILEILQHKQAPATFFMVGKHVELFPETALAVAASGHDVGNHTWSHAKLHRTGPARTTEEIDRAHSAISQVTGQVPWCFRAPHGYRTPFVYRAIAPYGYRTFGWTLGVWDSARPGAERIRERVRRRLGPGSIVLLHDGDGYNPHSDRWQTVEALPGIIDDTREAGYRLAALSSLAAT